MSIASVEVNHLSQPVQSTTDDARDWGAHTGKHGACHTVGGGGDTRRRPSQAPQQIGSTCPYYSSTSIQKKAVSMPGESTLLRPPFRNVAHLFPFVIVDCNKCVADIRFFG
jgi:hypothetical protein